MTSKSVLKAKSDCIRFIKLFQLTILGIFLFAIAAAASQAGGAPYFVTEQSVIKDVVAQGEAAKFRLTVYNNAEDDSYKIYLDSDAWEIMTDPLYVYQTEYGMTVPANKSSSATVFIKPASPLVPGVYRINLYAKSKNHPDNIAKEGLFVTIKPESPALGEYLPAVRADVTTSSGGMIDPRTPATIYVKLDNLNPLNISDLYIYIESNLFTRDRHIPLSPLEQKTEEFTVSFNPLETPKKIQYTVTIKRGNEILKTVVSQMEITAYTNLEKKTEVKKSFFRNEYTYTYSNDGNLNRQETIQIPTTNIKKFFTKSTPEASITQKEGTPQLTYYFNLKPQEGTEIKLVEDFRILIFLLILLAAVIVLYYVLRSPIIIKKEVSILKKPEHGISELKILLYIKNRAGQQFNNVKVMDKVPTVAEMQDEFVLGTLKPTKVLRNEKKGTYIDWDLKTLEPYEERIISYKIKSKLSILGFFNLPPAMLKYLRGAKETKIFSNKVKAVEK